MAGRHAVRAAAQAVDGRQPVGQRVGRLATAQRRRPGPARGRQRGLRPARSHAQLAGQVFRGHAAPSRKRRRAGTGGSGGGAERSCCSTASAVARAAAWLPNSNTGEKNEQVSNADARGDGGLEGWDMAR